MRHYRWSPKRRRKTRPLRSNDLTIHAIRPAEHDADPDFFARASEWAIANDINPNAASGITFIDTGRREIYWAEVVPADDGEQTFNGRPFPTGRHVELYGEPHVLVVQRTSPLLADASTDLVSAA
jgi:hypothetical protein